MPTKKFTVTLPDGTVAKRSSQRANYAYVIVSAPATQEARTAAFERRAAYYEAKADELDAAANAGVVKVRDRGFGRIGRVDEDPDNYFHSHEAYLEGSRTAYRGSRKTNSGSYPDVSVHTNHKGEHETWARFAQGINPVRPTKTDHQGEQLFAYPARDYLIACARETAARNREQAAAIRVDGHAPDDTGYCVLRWSSRRDLAEKALTEFAYEVEGLGRALRVVPVD